MMSEKTRTPPGGHQKSLADYDAEGRAVRANMEKLRALRLAKEAAEAASAPPKAVKKAAVKKKKAEPPAKLSDWLANQQKGGFRT